MYKEVIYKNNKIEIMSKKEIVKMINDSDLHGSDDDTLYINYKKAIKKYDKYILEDTIYGNEEDKKIKLNYNNIDVIAWNNGESIITNKLDFGVDIVNLSEQDY